MKCFNSMLILILMIGALTANAVDTPDSLVRQYRETSDPNRKIEIVEILLTAYYSTITEDGRSTMGPIAKSVRFGEVYRSAATDQSSPMLRMAGLRGLENSVDPRDLVVLSELLDDVDSNVRKTAVDYLGKSLEVFHEKAPVNRGSNSDGPYSYHNKVPSRVFNKMLFILTNGNDDYVKSQVLQLFRNLKVIDAMIFAHNIWDLARGPGKVLFESLAELPQVEFSRSLINLQIDRASNNRRHHYITHPYDFHYVFVVFGNSRSDDNLDRLAEQITRYFSGNEFIIEFFETNHLWSQEYFLSLLSNHHIINSYRPIVGAREALEARENLVGKDQFINDLVQVLSASGRVDEPPTSEQIGALEYLLEKGYINLKTLLDIFSHHADYRRYYIEANGYSFAARVESFDRRMAHVIENLQLDPNQLYDAIVNTNPRLNRVNDWRNILGQEVVNRLRHEIVQPSNVRKASQAANLKPSNGPAESQVERVGFVRGILNRVRATPSTIGKCVRRVISK